MEDVPPVPPTIPNEVRDEILALRAEAIGALTRAEDFAKQAQHWRRQHKWYLKRYQRLLEEHGGQLSILDPPEVSS